MKPIRAKKGSKYKARGCVIDGHKFPSLLEGKRYVVLRDRMQRGEIRHLRLQPRYPIKAPNGKLICTYIADFTYVDSKGEHIEDTKGMLTDVFALKKKMMLHLLGLHVEIVRSTRHGWTVDGVPE